MFREEDNYVEKIAKRFYPDRADDRVCDHRYSGSDSNSLIWKLELTRPGVWCSFRLEYI